MPADLPRPTTGDSAIDEALAVVELGDNVHEHPEQLADALKALQDALNRPAPTRPSA